MDSTFIGLDDKLARVALQLRSARSVVVALSGGVDSAVLLALAVDALGSNCVLAATGRSPAVPQEELEDARRVAEHVGARWLAIDTFELDRPDYRANDGQRCFHCRAELFDALALLARTHGIERVTYGAIVDDLGDDRPGMRAAAGHGILAPLLDAGIHKAEVRQIASARGLPVRDKPAAACLASRIPTGTEVTPARLAQVAQAERALRSLGFSQLRVRHHGEIARIEVAPDEMGRFADESLVAGVVERVRAAGFRFVTLDLEGYRPASSTAPWLHSIGPARPKGQ